MGTLVMGNDVADDLTGDNDDAVDDNTRVGLSARLGSESRASCSSISLILW